MKKIIIASIVFGIAACNPVAKTSEVKPTPSFDKALAEHIRSIQSRDLDAYINTITMGNELPLILSNGVKLNTRQDVIDLHINWFKDKKWVQKQEVVWRHVNGEMAVATIKYSYQDTSDGPPRYTYLGVVFEIQDGAWRLIHDQNTSIKKLQ